MVPDPLAPLHSDSLRAGRRPAGNAYFPVRIHSIDDIGDTVVIQGAIHCDYLEDMDTKKAKKLGIALVSIFYGSYFILHISYCTMLETG